MKTYDKYTTINKQSFKVGDEVALKPRVFTPHGIIEDIFEIEEADYGVTGAIYAQIKPYDKDLLKFNFGYDNQELDRITLVRS